MGWKYRCHTMANRSEGRSKLWEQYLPDTAPRSSTLRTSRGYPGSTQTQRRHQLAEYHWQVFVVRPLNPQWIFPGETGSRHGAATTRLY